MSFQILRVAKLKKIGNIAGSLHHTFRSIDTPNADPSRTHLNQNTYQNTEQALSAIKDRLPEKRRSDAVLCLEYLITASPEWQGWNTHQQQAYFDNALNWLKQKHGSDNVIMTSVQLDETTPHLVAYVVPLVNGRLNAKQFTGGKKALQDMQTDFHEKVAHQFNLDRGKQGSRAKHQTIQQFYTDLKNLGDELVLPEVQKGTLGFGGDSANSYRLKVEQVIGSKIDSLSTAVELQERKLQQVSQDLAKIEKETEVYRKALSKVGLGQVDKLNQVVTATAERLEVERKSNFVAQNLELLQVHDAGRLRSDAKFKYLLEPISGKVLDDERKYQKVVDEILSKSKTVRPSDDDIKQYAFAKKFLNTLADMRVSGEFMSKVRADNAKFQSQTPKTVTPVEQPKPVTQTVTQNQTINQNQQVRISKPKSDLDR